MIVGADAVEAAFIWAVGRMREEDLGLSFLSALSSAIE